MTTEEKSQRFLELQQIGFKNLKGQDREDYVVLKKELMPNDASEIAEPTATSSDEITVKKSDLDSMIADAVRRATVGFVRDPETEMNAITRESTWQELAVGKKRTHTATLKIYQKDSDSPKALVVNWNHHKFTINADEKGRKFTDDIYKLKLKYILIDENGLFKGFSELPEEWIEMSLIQFADLKSMITVEIIDAQKKTLFQSQGQVYVPPRDKEGYVWSFANQDKRSGETAELNVYRDIYTCTLKFPNGDTLTEFPQDRLNA